jgi:hypothetical protein
MAALAFSWLGQRWFEDGFPVLVLVLVLETVSPEERRKSEHEHEHRLAEHEYEIDLSPTLAFELQLWSGWFIFLVPG